MDALMVYIISKRIIQTMQLQEFSFVYEDLKEQLKEIPSLPLLLKSVEKTTKKLDCFNLYSLVDRRQFDFELFQQQTFDELTVLLKDVSLIAEKSQQSSVNMQQLMAIEQRIDSIKQQKMDAFDKLSKTEEDIQNSIDMFVDESLFNYQPHVYNEIKEVEEYEEEAVEEQIYDHSHDEDRIQKLKREIDGLNTKIVKINRGRGKWIKGDHEDFIKIYNRCRADANKIVEEGVRMLGMKNIQITDHLEVYQSYLQLEKEKKLASEEYKNIKFMEQQTKFERETQSKMIKEQLDKMKTKKKEEEIIVKKIQVEEFRRKKEEERQKIFQQITKEKVIEKKSGRISVEKKKEIEIRNLKMIEQKKEQFKQRSLNKANKSKPGSVLSNQETNSLKPKLPKPSLPLPQNKKI